jgi:hypothetical protein
VPWGVNPELVAVNVSKLALTAKTQVSIDEAVRKAVNLTATRRADAPLQYLQVASDDWLALKCGNLAERTGPQRSALDVLMAR